MLIHVVARGETIQSIADSYNVSVTRLIMDNGIENPNHLVVGQSIVIVFPEITYTVKEGDTINNIAYSNEISPMQLMRNNPMLSEREYIYPGETLVIKYKTDGKITTHGNTIPYINRNILKKTLPYLTYLSILNYTATKEGNIISYYDDTEVIELSKAYGVIPLMLITTLTLQGKANIGIAYDILLNKEFQNTQINNIITILKEKGYRGVNVSFEYINISNVELYEDYIQSITKRLNEEGYLVFVTVIPQITNVNSIVNFEKVDYTIFDQLAQNIIFMNYEWATNINPPSPISSIYNINAFLEYAIKSVSSDKIIIGLATIGYDWELPYAAGLSSVYSLTLDRAIELARNVGAEIQFDEVSQTPYFGYEIKEGVNLVSHIVWFIDARSMDALLGLVSKYNLNGTAIWNITIYNPQLWLIINSQYEIEKIPIE